MKKFKLGYKEILEKLLPSPVGKVTINFFEKHIDSLSFLYGMGLQEENKNRLDYYNPSYL